MMYLITQLWAWLPAAFLIGGIVGWMTCASTPTRWWTGWVPLAVAAFLIGLFVAVLKLVPGRAGLLLDAGLLMFGAYILGCCIGCMMRRSTGQVATVAAASGANHHVALSNAAPRATPATVAVARSAAAPAPEVEAPLATRAATASAVAAVPPPAAQVAEGAVGAADLPAEPTVVVPDGLSGRRPRGYITPLSGTADDLKRIRGIGKQNEGRLHALGIWHFHQIASWTREEIDWVSGYLAFPGRIDREAWVDQAKVLASGGETEFSQRVDRGEVQTSLDGGDRGQGNVAALPDKSRH